MSDGALQDGASQDWALTQTRFLTGDKEKDSRNVAILLDTIAAVSGNRDLDSLLRSIVDKAIHIASAERGIVLLPDEETGVLTVRVARDKLGNPLPKNLKFSTSIPQKVFEAGKAETLMDAAGGGDIPLGQSILDLRLVSVMCAPMKTAEETVGVLYIDSRASAKGFTKGDLELFTTLGSQCGLAINNAKLVQAYLDQQRMRAALHVAKDIQQGMMPRGSIERPRVEISGFNRPCEETGGDYFDFIPMPQRRIGVVIGDVSGHGIGAALFTTTAQALLRAFTLHAEDPAQVLAQTNFILERDMPPDMFMSLFFIEVDTKTGALRFASAGHCEIILFRKATGKFEELTKTGPALGLVAGAEYGIGEAAPLGPGDLVFLYTDGLPEAMSPDKELFEMERVKTLLAGLQERPVEEIIGQMVRAVTEFTKREVLEDDLTMVVIKGT
ncbi:MAG: GAF domain-containing SpoIIE family protein phosphatase [Planctomycetota bacterium]|jgi:serine phosphatase RsbU (regulator of sigma subunit)